MLSFISFQLLAVHSGWFQMATSSHQPTAPPSKRQKPSLQGEEAVAKNDGVDRISDLPDCLLCHILSFLPTTRQAVATSILSSRWKTLWTFVPCLYLKPWPWPTWNHPESVPFSFSHILSRVFAQHKKAPYLRKFHLHAEYPCDDCNAFHAGSYITAISPNLEELNLSICAESDPVEHNYSGPMLELPLSIFSCKNLVFLKLSGRIPFNLPSSFKLPSLKILHLLLNLYNDDSDWRLLSGCPVLEELYICRDGENHRKVVKFKIFVPTLKRLEMDFFVGEFDHPDYDIEINAPALEYFHFSGDLRSLVFSEKLSCLVEANVDVCPLEYYGYGKDYGDYGDSLVVLLRELYNVKVLSLSMDTTESFSSILNAHESCQKEPLYVPSDLSPHLATFCFKGFEGLKDELKFVRCILKKSRVLKKMTFKYGGSYRNAVVEKSHILKKVLNLPRRSMSCQIAFE